MVFGWREDVGGYKHCGAFHHEAPFRINVVRAVRYWLDEYYELRRTVNHAMRCG